MKNRKNCLIFIVAVAFITQPSAHAISKRNFTIGVPFFGLVGAGAGMAFQQKFSLPAALIGGSIGGLGFGLLNYDDLPKQKLMRLKQDIKNLKEAYPLLAEATLSNNTTLYVESLVNTNKISSQLLLIDAMHNCERILNSLDQVSLKCQSIQNEALEDINMSIYQQASTLFTQIMKLKKSVQEVAYILEKTPEYRNEVYTLQQAQQRVHYYQTLQPIPVYQDVITTAPVIVEKPVIVAQPKPVIVTPPVVKVRYRDPFKPLAKAIKAEQRAYDAVKDARQAVAEQRRIDDAATAARAQARRQEEQHAQAAAQQAQQAAEQQRAHMAAEHARQEAENQRAAVAAAKAQAYALAAQETREAAAKAQAHLEAEAQKRVDTTRANRLTEQMTALSDW